MVPAKAGAKLCTQCCYICKNEEYRLTHRFVDGKEDADLLFCSRECMMEYFEDELFFANIEEAVDKAKAEAAAEIKAERTFLKKEHERLTKQVCPACVRRITRLSST